MGVRDVLLIDGKSEILVNRRVLKAFSQEFEDRPTRIAVSNPAQLGLIGCTP